MGACWSGFKWDTRGLLIQEVEHVGGLLGGAAFVIGVDDFVVVHQIGGTTGEDHAVGTKRLGDLFLRVGQ